MTAEGKLAKRKVVLLAASLCAFMALSSTLPAIAARHGFPVVWIVLPVVAIEVVTMVYVLLAFVALKRQR